MDALLEESLALRARYDEEPSHSDHVAHLALQIFDGLQSWHKMGPRLRELLHGAALLHDIGWSQTPDGKGHNKWSARLIREHAWTHLNGDDRTHTGRIERVEVSVAKDAITLRVQPAGMWNAERAMFETKRDMLQIATGRALECVPME